MAWVSTCMSHTSVEREIGHKIYSSIAGGEHMDTMRTQGACPYLCSQS